ncbi:MAG: SufD family Fe-S cluster assembly protein [Actinobacteria bacterium]|nr:SufD family Fe-S cluster assembly protein [Actinomycetota bacterium]
MTPPATPTLVDRGRPDLPTNRDEDWRYAPLKAIVAAIDATTGPMRGEAHTPATDELAALLEDLPAGYRVVLVDGRYAPELSAMADGAANGPAVDVVDTAAEDDPTPRDAFELWNRTSNRHTVRVRVGDPGDGDPSRLVHLVHLTTASDGPSHPRVEIEVPADRRATVVETFRSLPDAAFTNATTTLHVGTDAGIDHLVVLQGDSYVVRTVVIAEDRSRATAGAVAIGHASGHHRLDVELAGPGAEVSLTGLTVAGHSTHHDTLAAVDHLTSHGTSRQLFASIVADGARASFTGQVVVAHGTVGTDADQQNRNLLLGPGARADTRPWLEIHSDEVACTHGATVGRLDDDAVFYLRSRGIADRTARTMLMRAFATTVVDQLASNEAIRTWLEAAVDEVLDEIVVEAASTEGRR